MFASRHQREFQRGFSADELRRQRGRQRLSLRKKERECQRHKRRKSAIYSLSVNNPINSLSSHASGGLTQQQQQQFQQMQRTQQYASAYVIELAVGSADNMSRHQVMCDKVCKYCNNIVYFAMHLNDTRQLPPPQVCSKFDLDADTWVTSRSMPWNLVFNLRTLRVMLSQQNVHPKVLPAIVTHSFDNKSVAKVLIQLFAFFTKLGIQNCNNNNNNNHNNSKNQNNTNQNNNNNFFLSENDVKWLAKEPWQVATECAWVLTNLCSVESEGRNESYQRYGEFLIRLCKEEGLVDTIINALRGGASKMSTQLVSCCLWCIANISGEGPNFSDIVLKKGILEVLDECASLLQLDLEKIDMHDLGDICELMDNLLFLLINICVDRVESSKVPHGQNCFSPTVTMAQTEIICNICVKVAPLLFAVTQKYQEQSEALTKYKINYQIEYERQRRITSLEEQLQITNECSKAMEPLIKKIETEWKYCVSLRGMWEEALKSFLITIDCISNAMTNDGLLVWHYFIDTSNNNNNNNNNNNGHRVQSRHGLLRYVIKWLDYEYAKDVVKMASRIVGNLCSSEDEMITQSVLDYGILNHVCGVLKNKFKYVRREMVWTVGNITAGTMTQVEQLVSHGNGKIMDEIVKMGLTDVSMIRNECVHVIGNVASRMCDRHEVFRLKITDVMIDVLKSFSACHNNNIKPQLIEVVLEALECFLPPNSNFGRMKQILEESGTISKLDEIAGCVDIKPDITDLAEKLFKQFTDGVSPLQNRVNNFSNTLHYCGTGRDGNNNNNNSFGFGKENACNRKEQANFGMKMGNKSSVFGLRSNWDMNRNYGKNDDGQGRQSSQSKPKYFF